MARSEKFKFSKSKLNELPPATDRDRYRVFDTVVRGFCLLVTKTGHKSFYLNRSINQVTERMHIGPYPDLTVEMARKQAEILAAEIAMGKNPQDARKAKRKELTLGELMEEYLERHAKKRKRSWKADEDQFRRHAKHWEERRLSAISRRQVEDLHNKIGEENGTVTANRLLSLLRTLYNMAIKWDLFDGKNPTNGISMFKEEARQRYVTAEEMPVFLKTLNGDPNPDFRDYVMLSLFTGLRQNNILGMEWKQIGFDAMTYTIPRAKNGKPFVAGLPEPALLILKRRFECGTDEAAWVFPHPKSMDKHRTRFTHEWKKFIEKAGFKDLRMHDLRHTLATWMANTGADLAVIQKVLGHSQIRMTDRYAHHSGGVIKDARAKAIEGMMGWGDTTE